MNVSESALRSRLSRKLAHDVCTIHKFREGSREYYEHGPYYIVNERGHCVDGGHLEDLADKHGVLREGEHLPD